MISPAHHFLHADCGLIRRALGTIIWTVVIAALASSCAEPRMKRLAPSVHPPRPADYPIDVYVGKIAESHRPIAIVESREYAATDEAAKENQIEDLRRAARSLGADAVHNVRILVKKTKGYVRDERTPFPDWKQAAYPLYFARGTAIVYESGLPGATARGDGYTAKTEGFIPPAVKKPESGIDKTPEPIP